MNYRINPENGSVPKEESVTPAPEASDITPPLQRTEPTAIIALCLAVAGPATCGISAIVGAIMGRTALAKVRKDPYLAGEGMAKAGMIVGWIIGGLLIVYVVFIAVIAILLSTGAIQ